MGSISNSYAAARVDCVLTDSFEDNTPGASQASFSVEAIKAGKCYLICSSSDVQKGQVVSVTVGDVDPSSNPPPSLTKTVDSDASSESPWIGKFTPTLPSGVPIKTGSYDLQVYLDKELVQNISVNVTE